jgi:flagellar biosynthesis/type III secretory pathway ATPase
VKNLIIALAVRRGREEREFFLNLKTENIRKKAIIISLCPFTTPSYSKRGFPVNK